ncbi:Vacuolar protein-sorting-associated protein 33 [Dispira simplex]|nr:Vacuolar protein-sorting-associated protein 33 [Dispira simplex]
MRSPTHKPTGVDDIIPTTHGKPDFTVFQELARKGLTETLDAVRGTKVLVIDPALSSLISLVAEFSLLKDHGVERVFHIQPGRLETDNHSVLYLTRPNVQYAQWIADQVRDSNAQGETRDYTLYFCPRRTLVCDRILEEHGVLGDLTVGEFPMDFVPLEKDVATLGLDDCIRTLLVDDVPTSLFSMGRALMRLQAIYGFFPRIVGKGRTAKQLGDMLVRMRRELAVDEPMAAQSCTVSQTIDTLLIIDRQVDLISPLCTQLTYEGLIDERFGIKNSLVEVDANFSQTATASTTTSSNPTLATKKKKIPLNSKDGLFTELRDLNFSVVGGWLHRAAKRINQDYEGRHQAKTISQLRQFIGKLSNLQTEHQSLKLHTYLAEELYKFTLTTAFNKNLEFEQTLMGGAQVPSNSAFTDYLDELIGKQAPLPQVLRLLCLQSLVNNGLKSKMYDYWRREIVQTYGYQHLITLERLARLQLLVPNPNNARGHYNTLKKSLHLLVEDVDEVNPDDIAFVYSGFAPLSVRLVQCIIRDPTFTHRTRPAHPRRFGLGNSLDVTQTWNSLTGPIAQALGAPGHSAKSPNAPGESVNDKSNSYDIPASQNFAPMVNTTGWKGFEDIVQYLPGPAFDCVQTVEDANPYIIQNWRQAGDRPTTVVFFVGGCTYAEIAAIRFLAQNNNRDFLIATTHIINGNSLMESIAEPGMTVP